MEITHKNPGTYKTARMSAMPINILYFISCIIGAFLIFTFVPDVGAKNHDYCDRQFDRLMFREVPVSVQKVCENRFIYNVNKIKRSHPLYSNKK